MMGDSLRQSQGNKKSKIISSIIVMLLFCVAHVMLFQFHEAWRDESQAWVLVRNSSFSDLFRICASEGHPALWFLILYPFTRAGFSFYNFSYISIIIMTAAVGIWIYYGPFSLLTKLSVVFSPIFFYYNPIICRVYAVLVLLFMLIACIWEKRFQHTILYGILVGLLIQSHILVIGVALGLLIDMVLETVVNCKREKLKLSDVIGLIIPIISLICFLFELRQRRGEQFFIKVSLSSLLRNLNLSNVFRGLLSVSNHFGKWIGPGLLTALFVMSFSLIYSSAKKKSFRSYVHEFIIMLCGFSAYWGIIVLVRKADHVQMAIVFWMIVLFCCWIYVANDKMKIFRYLDWAVGIICAFSALFCVTKDAIFDVREFYSGSKEIVEQINDTAPAQSVLIFENNERSTSPYAYLVESENQYSFWDIDNAEEYSVHIWGKNKKRNIEKDDIIKYAKSDFSGETRALYFVSSAKLDPAYDNAIICANTKPDKWNETYWVYDLNVIHPMEEMKCKSILCLS